MKISIITATKNNKAGLFRALECVQNQTYKNVEHIIVDGGSVDGSTEILKQVQDDLRSAQGNISKTDSGSESGMTNRNYSLLTISEPDEGIYDAINKGIKLATGDVIGLLHSDDLYADENVIERYAEVFNDLKIDAAYSDLVYVSQKSKVQSPKSDVKRQNEEVRSQELGSDSGQARMTDRSTTNNQLPTSYSIIRYWKTHKSVTSNQSLVKSKNTDHQSLVTDNLLKKGWMPPHPTLFIRREIFEKYGLYNTDLKIASDYDMILRLLFKHKINTCYLPVTTYLMSIGGASNKSLKNILQKSKEDYLAMKINCINFPVITLFSKNFRKLHQFLARDLS